MKKTAKRILSVLLTAVLVFGMLPAVSLASEEFTVVISMEGLTLGQGMYVEPKAYTLDEINGILGSNGFPEYSENTLTAAGATVAMLLDNGLDFTYTGGLDQFYLSSVSGIDKGFTAIPDYIAANGGPSDEDNSGNDDDALGEFDYSEMSGWMASSGDALLPTGTGVYILHDGRQHRIIRLVRQSQQGRAFGQLQRHMALEQDRTRPVSPGREHETSLLRQRKYGRLY
ncbi:MAG: hypothetical protein ILP09_01550, partial [Oscillospiraceae bacterium]|nr:hypothetical protein [Oscillospiraceae bacterium]